MDKKFLISVGLSLATVWAFQYFWYKPAQGSNEVTVNGEKQAVPKPGEAITVAPREGLNKPLKTNFVFEAGTVEQAQEVVIDMPLRTATVSSRGGGLSQLSFKHYKGKDKTPLVTVSSSAVAKGARAAAIPAFTLMFDDVAPLDYKIVESTEQTLNRTVMQTTYKNWLVTKEFFINEIDYKVDVTLRFEPLGTDVAPIYPRLFVPAPVVSELGEEQPSAFLFNENRNEVEKITSGSEFNKLWYWMSPCALIGLHDKYFVHALIGDQGQFAQRAYFHRMEAGKREQFILEGPEVVEKSEWKMNFYMGPKVYSELVRADERLGFVAVSGWLAWLTKLVLKFLDFVSKYVSNLGLAIIVLAVLLKLPLTPLTIYSSMKMERYQKHQPIINRIRAKFKNDTQMQLQEVSKYHQEHNISPSTPLIGCLPMLIQLPVMYSLLDILNNYIQLYQAPFFGWITDLSSKDPFYVIPILMGATMLWQQAMAPVNDEKQRVMMFFVSIVMSVIFAGLPVGLVLYWLTNSLLTIIENYVRRWFFA